MSACSWTLRALAWSAIADPDARLVLEDAVQELPAVERWAVAIGLAALAWAVEAGGTWTWPDRPWWALGMLDLAHPETYPMERDAAEPTDEEARALGLLGLLSLACDWEWEPKRWPRRRGRRLGGPLEWYGVNRELVPTRLAGQTYFPDGLIVIPPADATPEEAAAFAERMNADEPQRR